jgi:hypothetical protein
VAAAAPFHSEDKDPTKTTAPTKDPRGARPMDRKPQRSKGGRFRGCHRQGPGGTATASPAAASSRNPRRCSGPRSCTSKKEVLVVLSEDLGGWFQLTAAGSDGELVKPGGDGEAEEAAVLWWSIKAC